MEKDLTLDIAERVRQLIVQRGFEAVMTRHCGRNALAAGAGGHRQPVDTATSSCRFT